MGPSTWDMASVKILGGKSPVVLALVLCAWAVQAVPVEAVPQPVVAGWGLSQLPWGGFVSGAAALDGDLHSAPSAAEAEGTAIVTTPAATEPGQEWTVEATSPQSLTTPGWGDTGATRMPTTVAAGATTVHPDGHAVGDLVVPPVSATTSPAHAHHPAHQPDPGRHPCRPGHHRPPRCETILHGYKMDVFCSGGVHKVSRSRSHKVKTSNVTLVLCYWPDDTLDPSKLTAFPRLHRLEVTESNVTEVLDFPYHDHLEELVLSGLRLTWLGDDVFAGLRRLRVLDISRNQLSVLASATLLGPPSLRTVLLGGNPWRCTLALAWLTELRSVAVADADAMQCGAALYPRMPVMAVLSLLKRVSAECPVDVACSCELTRLFRDARGAGAGLQGTRAVELVSIITVNCSHRGLSAMPDALPANTTTLLLRDNRIRSVRPLVDKHAGVQDVYLDNNEVESIDDLEGSAWLTSFRVLSLRANKLQQLPTYALENALERNEHAVRVYLGLNPWRCDCQFMPTFQELLAKYKSLIADWDDIRCAEVDGDDNSMKKIHGLSRSAVCREEPLVTALDLANAALGASLFAVLAKLLYDYWQYRRYGLLPWIATKLP